MASRAWVLLSTMLLGCASNPAEPDGVEPDALVTEDTLVDETAAPPDAQGDTAVADMGVDAWVPSECPVPATITTAQVPSTYFPAERVNLNYTVDGDTAHFFFASGEHIVRFLYVNTEETSGAEKTAFGLESKALVDSWLRGAKEIKVAPRKNSKGTNDVDPFGRWLGLVFIDDELLETRLIRVGHSVYFTSYGCAPSPLHESLLYAEAEANANNRGIWSPSHPKNYQSTIGDWKGTTTCRNNPFTTPYCK